MGTWLGVDVAWVAFTRICACAAPTTTTHSTAMTRRIAALAVALLVALLHTPAAHAQREGFTPDEIATIRGAIGKLGDVTAKEAKPVIVLVTIYKKPLPPRDSTSEKEIRQMAISFFI